MIDLCRPQMRACGGLALELAGETVLCRPAGGLWLERWRALVVSDLHLEKGSAYALRGQMLPPYDTDETLTRLEGEVRALAPRKIIFLGDTFHDHGAEARLTQPLLDRLAALADGRTIVWVAGNHDAAPPARLHGETAPILALGGLTLGHAPQADDPAGAVSGHLHPCARVAGRGGSVRRRCFVTDGERLILPAFGAYAGGLNILDPAFAPLMRRRPLAGVLGKARVHAVGWASLRGD